MDDLRTYNAEDIQRYLQQKMSAEDMHAFEKAMMNDPFLADAIEGYKQSNEAVSAKHLHQLQRKLKGENDELKVVAMPVERSTWWKAAAVILFIITGALSYVLWDKSTTKNIAQVNDNTSEAKPLRNEYKQTPADTILHPNATAALSDQPQLTSGNKSSSNKELAKADDHANQTSDMVAMNDDAKNNPPASLMKQAPPVEAQHQSATNDETKDASLNTARAQASAPAFREVVVAGSATASSKRISQVPDKNENLQGKIAGVQQPGINIRGTDTWLPELRGRVMDVNGNPIPSASIILNKSNISTSTDANGNFSIKSPDSSTEVVVNSVGYAGSVAKLKSGTSTNNIVLKPAPAMLNDVVVGYGTQKKKDVTGSVSSTNNRQLAEGAPATSAKQVSPEPKGGWKSFDDYVNKEISISKDTTGNSVYDREDVVLEFSIDKKGRPVDITIVRTGTRNDALQAISILKKGPLWSNTVKDARVVYTFNFKR